MAWQQYSSWTPLSSRDGDLGNQRPDWISNPHSYIEDTSYQSFRPHFTSDDGTYEMDDRRSYISSAPLLQSGASSIHKSSVKEPSIRESISRPAQRRGKFSGWKIGVIVCAATACAICLLNISLTLWAVTNHELIGGLSYLYTGSCSEVASMSLWIHLGINAVSTMLLSANTMQIISSPTRKEIDEAHRKSRWLDIGIPSTRNLRMISWNRIFMWSILGLSSVPLHLMYNTAVFSSLSANAYDYIVVGEDFLGTSATYNYSSVGGYSCDLGYPCAGVSSGVLDTMHELAVNGTLANYTSVQCMEAYSTNFVSKFGNVLLVTSNENTDNNSVFASNSWINTNEVPYYWICGTNTNGDLWSGTPYSDDPPSPACTVSIATSGASNWMLGKYKISYCMVQEVVEECQLSFSLVIMLVVIAANAGKASIMILTIWKLKHPALVTIGDAVASFLDDPDPTTKGICLSTKLDIQKKRWKMQPAKPWTPKKHFWFRGASVKRWLICNILCLGFIGFGIYLLIEGMDNIGITNLKDLYDIGFGAVNANSVVSVAPRGLIATTLFANMPQAILSFLYLTYNGLFSCMLGGYEWSRFALFRKPLRVTAPVGRQRSTYYLQLPYTYAIPLLLMSGGLHWLMSQSLFLALVTVYDDTGALDESSSISTVGYSCIAIFFALILGSVAVLGGIANGFRRYNDGIPLVGSCSAAISAACQRPAEDSMASLKPVMWGVVEGDHGEQNGVRHCCFTSLEVGRPEEGALYAGMKGNKRL